MQTAILFGHYLHHFPFFGKRDDANERDLLAAAELTKSQAFGYFGWDDSDWCGTERKPKVPKPKVSLINLANVIFPAGVNVSGANQNPDIVTSEPETSGTPSNILYPQMDTLFAGGSSRLNYLENILKLPIWVIVCFPVDIWLQSTLKERSDHTIFRLPDRF